MKCITLDMKGKMHLEHRKYSGFRLREKMMLRQRALFTRIARYI